MVSTKEKATDKRSRKEERLVEKISIDESLGEVEFSLNPEKLTGMKDRVIIILPSLASRGSKTSGSARSVEDLCNHVSRSFYSEQTVFMRTQSASQLSLHPCFNKLMFMGNEFNKQQTLQLLLQTLTTTALIPYFNALQNQLGVAGPLIELKAPQILAKYVKVIV